MNQSPLKRHFWSGTSSTEETSEQNRPRGMEIRNRLTVTRGEGEGEGTNKGIEDS